jgi:hypothetical protein
MAGQPQREPSMFIDQRTAFNLCTFAADAAMRCFTPFTRCHQGTRSMGLAGFGAMLLIPLWAGFAHAPDMLAYWHFWLAMVIYRRITADRVQHTQYQGWPWMFRWCANSELNARLGETAAMPVLGGIVSAFSEDVGRFITVFGTFSYVYRFILDAMTVAHREQAAHNAIRQMEASLKDFQRGGRGR